LLGKLAVQFRGAFIVNMSYDSGSLFPGSFAFHALPPGLSHRQFLVSPSNTVVGFKLSGLSFGRAAISGAMDVNLRSPAPLQTANTLSPQFYDVHMQFAFELWRIIIGQYPDVLLPLVPDTINSFPAGYVPGAIGFVRPQVRADFRFPFGERLQALAQGSVNRPLQTFELSDQIIGRQSGVPDLQGRLAIGFGQSERIWVRPLELGLAGHFGQRLVTEVASGMEATRASWSVAGDLHLSLPTGTIVKGRLWRGQVIGDYAGAIFQTINPVTYAAIRAWGMWIEAQQHLSERWRVSVGYGRDDAYDADLNPGDRALNDEAFANLLWDVSKTLGFGAEGSRWETAYMQLGATRVWRGDLLFYLRF
jgi:hypothetical protein